MATAVQRGNAVAWLSGYSRAMVALVQKRKADGKQRKEQDSEVVSECESVRTMRSMRRDWS